MQPDSSASISAWLDTRPARLLLDVINCLIFLACGLLILLTIGGYGTLSLEGIPANATVRLNGRTVATTSFKLRPGDYQIAISSPTIAPLTGTIHVGLQQHATYKPTLKQRSADAIASSVLGAVPGTSLSPHFSDVRWFDDGTWIAGSLTPTQTIFAAHYDGTRKQWVAAFYSGSGGDYPDDPTQLPAAVAAYVQPLVAATNEADL